MPIFKIQNKKLIPVTEKKIDLERDIQKLTEENLETVFGLKFVSGFLNQEFSVRSDEQDYYIDTLAFDESQKSFVIIEYKKERSFSVIDQGFAYLSAMLNHKADFVLEINKRLNKNFSKESIDWEQSRVIFISPEFTNYQKGAINFRDLPFFLYEVRVYEDGIFEYDPIKPYKTTDSISSLSKNSKTIQKVSKEIKVYSEEDLVKDDWTNTKELLGEFEEKILNSEIETKIKYTKMYIAYMSKHGRNYVEIVPQKQGLMLYFRFPISYNLTPTLKLIDCSKIGHWTNGITRASVTESSQIPEAIRLSKESFHYLHKDIKA